MNPLFPLAAFFDLDGTLAENNQPPAAADLEAIHAFQRAGNYAFLCTGRSRGYLYDAVFDIGFDGLITGAGANITVGDRQVYRNFVSPSLIPLLVDVFADTKQVLVLETEQTMVQVVSLYAGGLNRNYPRIHNSEEWMAGYSDHTVTKLTVYDRPMEPRAEQLLRQELDLIVHPHYYEAVPRGCSKSDGIRRVLEVIGVPQENTIAFGDSPNDTDMIRYAGLGVVMGNGETELKALADRVTLPLS